MPLIVRRRVRVDAADCCRRFYARRGPGLVRCGAVSTGLARLVDGHDSLVTAHRCLTGRPHGVEGNARLGKLHAQVARETGRTRLDEERAESRVLREHQSTQGRGLGDRALEVGLVRPGREVHGVVGGQLVCLQVRRDDARSDGFAGSRVLPGIGSGLGGGYGVRVPSNRENGRGSGVVVGRLVVVDALGVDRRAHRLVILPIREDTAQVNILGLQDHRLGEVAVLLLGGHGRHALNVEVHVRDRGARLDAHLHDPRGQHCPVQVGPLAVTDAVLDRADHRGSLVPHHGETGVQEAVTSVLRAVTRGFQTPIIVGGLLVHERDDLRTGQRRVHRLEQRRDARDVRGRQRGTRRIAVNLRNPPIGVGGVDPLPRRSEINGSAVIRALRTRQGRPQRFRVPILHTDRGDRGNAADLRRDHPRTFNGTVRDRRRIRRRVAVCRRVVDVDASVTGTCDHD